MDWSKGYSSAFYAKEVDPVTWRDIAEIPITGGTVKRTISGLRQSATLQCLEELGGIERWVRIYMDVEQNGSYAHEALFTGLAASPKRKAYASRAERTPDCYSVLKPADDVYLPRGWYAPAGQNGGEVIRQLLSVSPAPVDVADSAPQLDMTIIAEDNETRLTMTDKVLEAMGWYIDITGDGTIHVRPLSAVPVITLDPASYDVVKAPISITEDLYSAPNVYQAVSGDMVGIARDDREDSPLSVQNRGREVWAGESGVTLAAGETIGEYAQRQLQRAQRVRKQASYDRRYIPDVRVGSVITLHYPAQGLDGLFFVESQNVRLGHNAETAENVEAL